MNRINRILLLVVLAALAYSFRDELGQALKRSSTASPPGVTKVAHRSELDATLARIKQGGPFPYSRDGIVFGNRERLLPARPHGYYREYTVPTATGRRVPS